MIYFTSSWDDGSVYDLRLAELLLKYNQNATFYIPLANVEKRSVINKKQIWDLSKEFEIGAHTVNHKYLTTISNLEAEYEIKQSKKELENITGKQIQGFCFPGGKYHKHHLKYIQEAGFAYARTANMFKFNNSDFLMNISLQAYNHSQYTYFKHLIKRGYFSEIIKNSTFILTTIQWDKLLRNIVEKYIKNDSVEKITIIHLFGHSWELEEYSMWQQLEEFLKLLITIQIPSITNLNAFELNNNIK